MAISPAVLDAMVASGCSAEQIAAVVKADMAGRSSNAERQARHRARKSVTSNVTPVTNNACNADSLPKKETSPTPPKEKTTLPENPTTEAIASFVAPAGQKSVQAQFDEFWAAYPKRDGANPKHPAFEKFRQRVRSGADPEAIIAAAGRYAAECRAKGTFGSAFVTQAQTWLNQKRFDDYPEQAVESSSADPKPAFTAVEPGTAQWEAWYEFKRSTGATRMMDAAKREGKPYPVPSEYPPTSQPKAA